MSTFWRLFSSYIPTIRDDGRELELPILSSSSSSSSYSSPSPRGQRHDRPRRLAAQTTALKDIRARWDAEEMSDMRMALPCSNETTPTVRWHKSVKVSPSRRLSLSFVQAVNVNVTQRSYTESCLPEHTLGALVSPQETDASASTESQPSIDSSSGDSESTKVCTCSSIVLSPLYEYHAQPSSPRRST